MELQFLDLGEQPRPHQFAHPLRLEPPAVYQKPPRPDGGRLRREVQRPLAPDAQRERFQGARPA